eukprot:Unigene3333_Nuclearia_a/m.10223 Unigene3333_Nuclearia_a/g.10223  ORF Unigene3333_Nuclearia_a/g.10223 Unigene3333_Nuclearia_a/m.10223 type:complete len:418 (-) Unigene3333_Nuclearia_a:22-1275(-)
MNSTTTPPGGYDADAAGRIFVSIGVPFIILWAVVTPFVLLLVLKSCRSALRNDRAYFKAHPFVWFLGFLWLVVEFGQINWFSFYQQVAWPGREFLNYLNIFVLNYNLPWTSWFWIYAGYAILVLTLCSMLVCCCGDGGGDDIATIAAFILLTMIPIFQPTMYRMIQALTCTYPIGAPSYLDVMPDMYCWQGLHLLYAIFACIIVAIFYPAITIIMSLLIAGQRDRSVWLVFAIMQFKMVQVVIATLFYTYILGVLLAMLGINLVFVLVSVGAPSKSRVINLLRMLSFAMTVWATVCILVQFGVNDPGNWIGVIMLIVGWILLPLLFLIFGNYYLKRKGEADKELEALPVSDTMPPLPAPAPAPAPAPVAPSGGAQINISQVQYAPAPFSGGGSTRGGGSRTSTHMSMPIQSAYPIDD